MRTKITRPLQIASALGVLMCWATGAYCQEPQATPCDCSCIIDGLPKNRGLASGGKTQCELFCQTEEAQSSSCTGSGNPPECSTVHVLDNVWRRPNPREHHPTTGHIPCETPIKEQLEVAPLIPGAHDIKILKGTRFVLQSFGEPPINQIISTPEFNITCKAENVQECRDPRNFCKIKCTPS